MRLVHWLLLLLGVVVLGGTFHALSEEPREGGRAVRMPFGIDKRVLWTTSKVKGSPEPPAPYRIEKVFGKLTFDEPLEMVAVPGKDAWIIAERKGKIWTFANDPNTDKKHLLLDVKRSIYGVVPHPDFLKNGHLYVSNITDHADKPDGSRISRYTATTTDPPTADVKTEKVILKWPSGGHNGGCIRFGPDGYLYLVTGDGSGIADGLETGQNVNDLLASLLRIDVNRVEESAGYSIPPDNPFVNVKDARPEIYAYGLRQLWKFAFHPTTGEPWGGEVGQDLWEMVYRIEKGGNYGWSVTEGLHPFRPNRKKGPTPILPPVVEHPHVDFRSITGGYFYGSDRLPELKGAYVYGDYDTGKIWMLRWDGKKVTEHRELTDTTLRIVAWGQDKAGEVYAVDFIVGGIYRLVKSPPPAAEAPKFPRKLSETGLFVSTKDHKPAAGVIPYSVNAELWSDGAIKERFLAVPGDSKIEYETVTYPQPAPGSQPGWRFPDGTVLVKTFAMETDAGVRRLETRLLHAELVPGNEEVGDQVWNGYTYVWSEDQSDAELADAKGFDRKITVKDAKAPGGKREQVYHFPSRSECQMCHTVTAKYALGVNTMQMNRDHNYGGVIANQLATLEHLGLFTKPLPAKPERLAKLADYHDTSAKLEDRARAYLHANCSHCHRKWGGGNAEFQLLATLPLKETGTVNVPVAHGTFDVKDGKVLVPGDPERSLVYTRMTRRGLGQMPHIASNVVDEHGAALVREWIKSLRE